MRRRRITLAQYRSTIERFRFSERLFHREGQPRFGRAVPTGALILGGGTQRLQPPIGRRQESGGSNIRATCAQWPSAAPIKEVSTDLVRIPCVATAILYASPRWPWFQLGERHDNGRAILTKTALAPEECRLGA